MQGLLTMNDERCPIEKYARDFIWRWVKFLPREQAIENKTFIWKCTRLDCHSYLSQDHKTPN